MDLTKAFTEHNIVLTATSNQIMEEGVNMSEREKEILKKLSEVLPQMDDEDKEILVEKADSMAYMNRKWKKKLSDKKAG